MTYRLAFLCCNAQNTDKYYGSWNIREDQEENADHDEDITLRFTEAERDEIREMKRDPDLYHNMARSLAPTLFGAFAMTTLRLRCFFHTCDHTCKLTRAPFVRPRRN